jgi:hypothetical protein
LEEGASNTQSKSISVSEALVVNIELADTPIVAATSVESGAAPKRDGSVEGIDVHGHWTIEVRDPDGTLVERREFENALGSFGDTAIIKILGRQFTLSVWGVTISSGDQPCGDDTQPAACAIFEPTFPTAAPFIFRNLTVAVSGVSDPTDIATLTLSGFATAQRDGTAAA